MNLRARVRCLVVPVVATAALVVLPATQASAATFSAATTAQLVSAVASANAAAGADTIQLSAGASYAPSASLAITGDLTISGPSSLGAVSSGAKLDGGVVAPFPSPLLTVAANVQLTLANVLVTSGGGTGGSSQPAIDDSGTLVIQNSTLSGNNGAGVLVEQGATATITNSTIANGNDIGLTDLGTATLVNSTVAFNAIGGIDNSSGGALTLTNTIVAKNLFSDCSAAASTQTRSLDGDGTCGVSVTAADPKLGAFVLDGGPTPTFPLQAGSAAINAGDNASCPATDQRFVARDASCDIGADEYNATKPTITVPASVTVPSAGASGATVTYTASASSPDDAVTSFSCAPASGSQFANGTTTVTCNAKDGHGNTQTASFPVTVSTVVVDTTPPVISVPGAPVVAEATSASGANVAYTASATDPDDAAGVLTLVCLPASGSVFPLGNTTVTCNAHDPAGNTATPATFTVTVRDTTAPVIAAHAGVTAAATGASGAAVSYTAPNASDAVKGTFAASCAPASGSTFAVGATTVTCSATDAAGNAATPTTFTVTVTPLVVVDTTPPVISVPGAPVVAEATGASGAAVAYTVSATDPDDAAGALTLACVPASGSVFPLGSTTVTCNAHDPAGNNATPATFIVTVTDTTAPVIAAHGGVTAVATGPSGAAVTYTAPNASDAVKGTFAASCAPAPGSTFAVGATTVTCNASDAAGNTATPTTFTVTVTDLPVVDTTPPVISVPGAPVVAEATSGAGAAVSYTVSATDPDDVASVLTLACVPASGSAFPLGNTTVTCNASDPAGNSATPATFTVTVRDTTAPVIAAHAGVNAVATGPSGAAVTYAAPNATDAVDGTSAASCAPASGSTFAIGTTTVTCNATDAAGNAATPTTFTVTVSDLPVVDTTPPVISVPGAPVVAEATSAAGANVAYTVSATDPDDAAAVLTLACVPASGSVFPLGNTTVTCNAHDPAGNTATPATFTVTVRDTTAPVIAAHAGVSVVATGPSGAAVSYTAPNATDAVKGTFAATCSPASGSTFAVGATTVTCNASDAAGNAATATTFTVTVTAATGGTPAERILDLQKQVRGSGIRIGLRFTLVGLLADARQSLLDGAHSASARHRDDDGAARACARGVTRACRRLNQFIATIALDSRRRVPRIPAALAASWTAQAQSIQAQLGCTTPAVPSSV